MSIDLSSLSFLVVEDSAYMRTILRTMLQGFGARKIVEAEDGASGLEAMERANPDILILDWVMPILDGADMVRMIRTQNNPHAYIPIIMVTAHTERSRIIEARKLGIHELLCKPISAKALYQRIASIILQPRDFVKTAGYFGPEPREIRGHKKNWMQYPDQSGPFRHNDLIAPLENQCNSKPPRRLQSASKVDDPYCLKGG